MAVVSVEDLAARAGCSGDTVRRACRAGEILGARQIGRVWVIPEQSGKEWAAAYDPYAALRQPRRKPTGENGEE